MLPPSLAKSSRSGASPDDLSVSVESDEAVLLSADAHGCDVGESSCLGDRLSSAVHQASGVDFGSDRMRSRAAAQDPARGRVDDDDLARLFVEEFDAGEFDLRSTLMRTPRSAR